MTDYTSQGKSREKNPVDLTHCNDHRSYYVALSRGFTAEGTIILQDFDDSKITSGMSGYLRQELRELEILDEITRLNFEGRLPPSVTGIYRRRLIRSYYAWKTDHRDPAHFHPAMRWDKSMGPRIPPMVTYDEWRSSIVNKKRKRASEPNKAVKKQKKDNLPQLVDRDPVSIQHPVNSIVPVGTLWDNINYSCGYDATVTVLANIWAEDVAKWRAIFPTISPVLKLLDNQLVRAAAGLQSLEDSRNAVRRWMNTLKPDMTSLTVQI
ncbi:hypothetical protein C8R43DRAFT_900668 [Mycena crocata]|nr:hypothetical protein C8R43DRAFT_900668 [Mycena crocata]